MRKTGAGILAATMAAAVTFVAFAAVAVPIATAAPETAKPTVTASAPAQPAGAVTGEYANGALVYRLAPVAVSMSREAALAAIDREDRAAAAAGEVVPLSLVPTAVAASPASVAPARNIGLDVAVAAFGTFVAILLSFGLAAGRRRRATAALAQPRQWVAAQPYVPKPAPAPAPEPGLPALPGLRAAASLATRRICDQRERRLAERRSAHTTQPDAA